MDQDQVLEAARASLATTGRRLADLVTSAPDLSRLAMGLEWNLQQVTAHMVTGTNWAAEFIKGNAPGLPNLDPAVLGPLLDQMIADFPESDPAKLGRLLLDAEEAFLEALAGRPGSEPIAYVGLQFTVAQFACLLLADQMLHGFEMAAAVGRPWPIDTQDALLVLTAHLPMFAAILHPERTRGLTATIGIQLRGGRDVTVRFTDGAYSVEEGTAATVDATMSVDPVAFLMIESGRLSRYEAAALGLLTAGGDQPDLALGFFDLIVYP
ncbi:MAG: SCP2 sterol-binding domain-containing protein [Acidimicrobiia bacterium]